MTQIISNVVHGNYATVKIETDNGTMLIEVDTIPESIAGFNTIRVSPLSIADYELLNPYPVDTSVVVWVESQRNLFDSLFSNL